MKCLATDSSESTYSALGAVRWDCRGFLRDVGDHPVLILHGWGASMEAVEPIVRSLEQETQVWTLDLPGFGGSKEPPEPWDPDDYAQFVLEFMKFHQIDRCHMLGHSFGGRIAICLCTSWPEKVDRLVLCASAGIVPRRPVSYWLKVSLAKIGRAIGVFGLAGRAVQRWLRSLVASVDYLEASDVMRQTLAATLRLDLSGRLGQVRQPTLLVWGRDDEDTPLWMGERMDELIPDSGLVVLENAGHYVYAEASLSFNRLVREFLVLQPRVARSD